MSARVSGDDGMVEALRARRNKGKEPIEREAMQDRRLSMKARGILGYLVSKPDKWRTSGQAIADDCDKDGRDSISTGLRELEEKGYLARKRRKKPDGTFTWCWIYSDDPTEVREVLEELFPDGSGLKPDVRRGRARKATVGGEPAAQTRNGFSVDGSSVDGSPASGSSVDGEPVDIESESEIDPPNPPLRGGDQGPPPLQPPAPVGRCTAHGIARCRACGLSPRVEARAARDQAAANERADAVRARACPMCTESIDGKSWLRTVPGRPALTVLPYMPCDHTTPHEQAVAELEEREAAAERARASRPAPQAPGCSPDGSAVARAALAEARASRGARPPDPMIKGGQDGKRSATGEVVSSPVGEESPEIAGQAW